MVRINLLPKEEKARRRAPGLARPVIKMPTGIDNYIGIAVLVLVIIVLSFVHIRQRNIIKNLNTQIEHTRAELRKLDEVVKLVKELDKKRKDLDARIEIIRDLNRGRFEKAKLMYTMSALLPDYCWVTNLDIKGTLIKLKGITFSNQVIADLMRKMQGSKMFGAVELKNIVGKEVDEHNVMEFDLTSNLISIGAPAQPTTARPPKKQTTTKE
jgi:type IV pilus assembly protein PilN